MYSPDRIEQFKVALACWQDIEGFDECQKILLVDNVKSNIFPDGFEVYTVPRPNGKFNWAAMWEAGVTYSQRKMCWYLDSDRILPKYYLNLIHEHIKDHVIIYTSNLFQFHKDINIEEAKKARDNWTVTKIKECYQDYKDCLTFDPRFHLPLYSPGKNAMSGNTAFTKQTYYDSGGVDPWYEAHGAFADTDYHTQCYNLGYKFIDLKELELHLNHDKLEENPLSFKELGVLGLNNMVRYCRKWGFPLNQVVESAAHLKIYDPVRFVKAIDNRQRSGNFEPLREIKTFL